MKKQKIALMLSVVLSASVMAQEEKGVQLFEQQVFQSESNTKMQLQELSQKEMEQTEGAAPMPPGGWSVGGGGGGGGWRGFGGWGRAVGNAVGGAVVGGYSGGYGYLAGGGKDPQAFQAAVVGGAVGGAFNPITGVSNGFRSFGGAVLGGAVGGHMASSPPKKPSPPPPPPPR